MQWKLFTAGVILAGVSAGGLVFQQVIQDRPAAASDRQDEQQLPGEPTTDLPSAAPTTTSETAPPSTSTAPTTTTTTTTPQILPTYPPSFPGRLARAIAAHDGGICQLFTAPAASQLAAATGAGSCPAAIEALATQVTAPDLYANPSGAGQPQPAGDRRVTVDACQLTWSTLDGPATPGPQIGVLTLEQPPDNVGYLIAGYQPC